MPLFVPILRMAMLFVNIYESYKTLKLPPSSRNVGRPSLRAISQRKRDMKGCLAVWIVWCCFAVYERFIEAIVSLFVPFYDEFKSMALLFLILTRARGAEPIYLHVIRPLLKPYTATVDSVFDVLRMLGDFMLALALFPLQTIWKKWHRIVRSQKGNIDSDSEVCASSGEDLKTYSTDESPKKVLVARQAPQSQAPTHNSSMQAQTEFWNPALSLSEAEERNDAIRISSSINLNPKTTHELNKTESIVSSKEIEEWRKYPAFPSAYPPTPLATSRNIMASSSASRQSSPSVREPLNPISAQCSSNNCLNVGSRITLAHDEIIMEHTSGDESNESDEYEEEEDEFNITLQTPYPPLRTVLPSRDYRFSATSSTISRSPTLTSADGDGLFLYNRTLIESPAPDPVVVSASVPGRKRALPKDIIAAKSPAQQKRERIGSKPMKMDPVAENSTGRTNKIEHTLPSHIEGLNGAEITNADEDEDEKVDVTCISIPVLPEVKKRRVALTATKRTNLGRPIRSRATHHASPPKAPTTRRTSARQHAEQNARLGRTNTQSSSQTESSADNRR